MTTPSNTRFKPDQAMADVADYVIKYKVKSVEAYDTARQCLMDSLGCAMEALSYPACTKLLGPVVPGTVVPNGAKVPGTSYQLDPVMAAFNIACLVRWVDFSDTWLAAEGGHPSDNLGGILGTGGLVAGALLLARAGAASSQQSVMFFCFFAQSCGFFVHGICLTAIALSDILVCENSIGSSLRPNWCRNICVYRRR